MDISAVVVILSALALAFWLNHALRSAFQRDFRVRVFLTIVSSEFEDMYGVAVPVITSHFYRDISLKHPPSIGTELDGLGTGPLAVARLIQDPDADFHGFVQLVPARVPKAEIEDFSAGLKELGWQVLPMSPPYPWPGPSNSFKPTPLRGAA